MRGSCRDQILRGHEDTALRKPFRSLPSDPLRGHERVIRHPVFGQAGPLRPPRRLLPGRRKLMFREGCQQCIPPAITAGLGASLPRGPIPGFEQQPQVVPSLKEHAPRIGLRSPPKWLPKGPCRVQCRHQPSAFGVRDGLGENFCPDIRGRRRADLAGNVGGEARRRRAEGMREGPLRQPALLDGTPQPLSHDSIDVHPSMLSDPIISRKFGCPRSGAQPGSAHAPRAWLDAHSLRCDAVDSGIPRRAI